MRFSRHVSMFIAGIILAQFACAADKDAARPTTKPASGAATSDDASAPLRRLPGLEGWHVTGNGNWTYKDGIIEGKQGADVKSYTHVVSDKSYKNFKATLMFKCVAGNSGFYFRASPQPGDKMIGIQSEIDAEKNVGGLYESYGRNWLNLPSAERVKEYFKPQEWNEMTVEGHGQHIVVHINGKKAGEIDNMNIRTEGPFALQMHGGQDVNVLFKDIKLEELP
jgi:hypothetical protein